MSSKKDISKTNDQKGSAVSDAREFLNSYQETLAHGLQTANLPAEVVAVYSFESCLKHDREKEIYLVRDKRTDGQVILRVTPMDYGMRADVEWEILSKLNHPGIPKTYGRLIVNGKCYIAREYIPGHPLDAVLTQRTLTPKDIFSFTRKICDILAYMHRQNPPVIHRDIKPQNIILRPDGSIVLTDFGIARIFKPGADSDTQYVGTLPYAPPEQYGYAQSTPQTDIYALGIVLVYLATGSPNRQDLQEKIRDKKLLALINRCIAFDPADRFASVDEILRFVDKAQKRSPKLIVGISAGLVALLLAIGLLVFFNPIGHLFPLIGPVTANSGSSGNSGNGGDASGASSENSASNGNSGNDASGESSSAKDSSSSTGDSGGFISPSNKESQLFDSTVTGNLTGNISNGGFAVDTESETFVVLQKGVFVLEHDGSLGRQVLSMRGVKSLNYYRGKLYFACDTPGLMCADPKTGEVTALCNVAIGKIYIDNDTLYFENGEDRLNLYTIGFDGSGMRKISDYNSVYYRNVVGGYQYFANTSDGEVLYRVNLTTGEEELIYDYRSAWISIIGSTVYFSDFRIPGSMMCMDLDGNNAKELYRGSYSWVSATPLGVFFTNPSGEQLEVMTLDGSKRTLLTQKKCGAFCVTRDWILYKNKDDNNNLWIMRPDGSEDRILAEK